MLSIHFWVWAFYWSVVDLLGATPLQNEFFLPPRSHQLSITLQQRVGECEGLLTPCWKVDWFDPAQVSAVAVGS